ncbi:MAG TPA: phosphomannomutase/phosphoglucomutase [Candidatus Cybelea sp.]|nr:phosphomannomutase/phosphoglucomutase [Candidatus Cybelea sp.]
MPQGHPFHPTILREYDIRGIVGETLSAADAKALGRAFATFAGRQRGKAAPRIAVGRDGRLSSPELEAALTAGIRATGATAVRIGVGPTPMLYFAAAELPVDAGIMVTGSHNPPTHNGFKMTVGGKPVYGGMIREIGRLAREADLATGSGGEETADVREDYTRKLASALGDADISGMKVAWDAGNGAAGEIMERLTARLKGTHRLLNEKIDGRFPAHHPDPTEPENLHQLQDLVAKEKLDLGIAFDGDGDRIGAIDAKGRIIWGDQLVAILGRDVLQRQPGATIIADVKASQALFDEIAKMGGKPLMWKTGHSLIKVKMAETKAPLAGEMSGHIFFADEYYGFDDALYAAMRLLRAVVRSGHPLTALRDRLPNLINTPEIRIPCPDEKKFAVVSDLAGELRKEGAVFNDVDGIRISKDGGWWLLRASNTQAVLVARAEAPDERVLASLKADLKQRLSRHGVAFAG